MFVYNWSQANDDKYIDWYFFSCHNNPSTSLIINKEDNTTLRFKTWKYTEIYRDILKYIEIY